MDIIRGLKNIKPYHQNAVVTIGNFDGVHLGHQEIIKQLKAEAKKSSAPAILITFEPYPEEFFNHHEKTPARLMRFREKLAALKLYGIDAVLVLRFNQKFSRLSASDFLENILFKALNIKALIIGDDFHFGFQREGNFEYLQKFVKQKFQLKKLKTVLTSSTYRISSTLIRQALLASNLNLAEQLLGRPFSLFGRVVHGQQRGRQFGVPTANLYLHRQVSPLFGVYAVRIKILNKLYTGVANIGVRPTIDGTRSLLEVHIFDFDQDIYGTQIEVIFVHKLRDEKKYDNFDLLIQQIHADIKGAKEFFVSG